MSTDAEPEVAATPELTALTNVVRALQALSAEDQLRVVESALVLLGTKSMSTADASDPAVSMRTEPLGASPSGPTDIRRLKEQKNPGSANEMAALVAYYLAEVVQGPDRKPAIEISDVEKYFKQANFRLPRNLKMTLVNAKNAGYFDATGGGKYKLNPVGYNLVVHSLPRARATDRLQRPRRPSQRKGQSRRNSAKKRPSGGHS
jgi:hypothetical protein